NESYAESHAFLADVIALGAQPADALDIAKKAVLLDPSSSSVRLSLARVLWALSQRDSARGTALAARALSHSDQERSQAEELIAFFNRAPAN
ncbi:MAG TPA: tetratricopeptide repeat protein, partial [Vicinamibacterales bacterium]|nr:tetratricopeptide repeat protein [Vicinamibacterales bacterium]